MRQMDTCGYVSSRAFWLSAAVDPPLVESHGVKRKLPGNWLQDRVVFTCSHSINSKGRWLSWRYSSWQRLSLVLLILTTWVKASMLGDPSALSCWISQRPLIRLTMALFVQNLNFISTSTLCQSLASLSVRSYVLCSATVRNGVLNYCMQWSFSRIQTRPSSFFHFA